VTVSLARRERHALCDLALALGPDAPTLCGGWTCRDLVAHLLVRENSLIGAAGISISPLAGLTESAMARAARKPFPEMVAKLYDPGITPYRLPGVERLTNTLEYLVHHEDLRRAQPDPAAPEWQPRDLSPADQDDLWKLLPGSAKLATRKADVPIVVRRSDRPRREATVRRGADPVVVTGLPSELVLFFFGRTQLHEVTFEGPPTEITRLHAADKGF
jgi:uncharacterized protein (TIGR03085 family)